jgi:hypothetical protein
VFYHTDCISCRREVPKYEELAKTMKANGDAVNVALIELPPYVQGSPRLVAPGSASHLGRMSQKHRYGIPTPAAFILQDGVVKHVTIGASVSLAPYTCVAFSEGVSV